MAEQRHQRLRTLKLETSMETFFQDLRYSARMLLKNPGFTAISVMSLALGIGANTTIFSFVNGLMFRPPAIADSGRLLEVWQHNSTRGNGIGSHMQLSYPDYEYYRDHNHVFTGMGALTAEGSVVTWNRAGEGEALQSALVSANFFSLVGIKPALGRTFLPDEDQAASPVAVVVLSHSLWQQRLGSDPAIVGKTLSLNGRTFSVIGVAPAGFTSIIMGSAPDLWIPMAMHFATNPGLKLGERHQHWLIGIGRLKPGVSPAQARADLTILGRQLSQDYPDPDKDLSPAAFPIEFVPAPFRGVLGTLSGGLMAVVALVLLIACANAANLLLAKASSRRREMAVRAALGASRSRLVRQTLTESVVIASLAGLLGLCLAAWVAPILLCLKPQSIPLVLDISIDVRVLAFTALASILTGVVFGLAPALQSSKVDHVTNLKDGSYQGGSPKSRLRGFLVIAQVTACVILLVGAGLCLRSLWNARSIDPGFNPHCAVTAALNVETFSYSRARGKIFYSTLLDRVRALPGVRFASLADHLPLSPLLRMESLEVDGTEQSSSTERETSMEDAIVAPGYFEAMGVPLLRGRGFSSHDTETAPAVVVINQALADRFWPNQDPLGKTVTLDGPEHTRVPARIVGIASTGKYQSLGEDRKPFFYKCMLQFYEPGVKLIVRTEGQPSAALEGLRAEVQKLDPRIALVGVETLDQHMQLPLFPARAAGLLLGAFGCLALALAVIGIYGVISYSVTQRVREIGIRMALGADPAHVLKLVVSQGLQLTGMGLAIGLVAAVAVTRVLSSLLYGISPRDGFTFAGVTVLLTLVAAVASYLPARRATKVDPISSLRAE